MTHAHPDNTNEKFVCRQLSERDIFNTVGLVVRPKYSCLHVLHVLVIAGYKTA
mgnify:FL=1